MKKKKKNLKKKKKKKKGTYGEAKRGLREGKLDENATAKAKESSHSSLFPLPSLFSLLFGSTKINAP